MWPTIAQRPLSIHDQSLEEQPLLRLEFPSGPRSTLSIPSIHPRHRIVSVTADKNTGAHVGMLQWVVTSTLTTVLLSTAKPTLHHKAKIGLSISRACNPRRRNPSIVIQDVDRRRLEVSTHIVRKTLASDNVTAVLQARNHWLVGRRDAQIDSLGRVVADLANPQSRANT